MAGIVEVELKQAVTGILLTLGLAGTVQAADLTIPAPIEAPPAPAFTWTGLYVGGHAGYGWSDFAAAPTDSYGVEQPNGFFGGGQAGFNYQFDNRLVLGIEADASFGDQKTGYTARFGDDDVAMQFGHDFEIQSFGTVRGRAGYAFDRLLPYVTGGLGWARAEMTFRNNLTVGDTVFLDQTVADRRTFTGWTLGAGLEYAVTYNITAKAEYLYSDLGTGDFDLGTPVTTDLSLQTVKLGLNYKF